MNGGSGSCFCLSEKRNISGGLVVSTILRPPCYVKGPSLHAVGCVCVCDSLSLPWILSYFETETIYCSFFILSKYYFNSKIDIKMVIIIVKIVNGAF